jgi:hypothetical protein
VTESIRDRLLQALDISAQHGWPMMRVHDVMRVTLRHLHELPEFKSLIEQLLADGTLVVEHHERDRCVGLRTEIERFKKEALEMLVWSNRPVLVMLQQAARKMHPGWKREGTTWKPIAKDAPATPEALIEWFEINHPAEAKKITRDYTTGNLASWEIATGE